MYGNKSFRMKKYSLVLLALSTVLVTGARAGHVDSLSAPVALPTYIVEAERSSADLEAHINRSLSALRELARTPVLVSIELPALKAPVALDANDAAVTRLAKI